MINPQDITVLIPAYNAHATLSRALHSVAHQTCSPAAIVIVDDGSTPALSLADIPKGNIPTTCLRLEQNFGSSVALNRGIEQIKTPWIAFLDADDEWLPNKLERQTNLQDNADLIATAVTFLDLHGKPIQHVGQDTLPDDPTDRLASLLADCVLAKPSIVVRKSIVERLGGFNPALTVGEDQDMWLRIAAEYTIALITDCLVYVHDTPGSLSKRGQTPPDFLWQDIILPMSLRHYNTLGAKHFRRIKGVRTQQAAWSCFRQNKTWLGMHYLVQSMMCGHQPLRNLGFAAHNLPFIRALKTHLRA